MRRSHLSKSSTQILNLDPNGAFLRPSGSLQVKLRSMIMIPSVGWFITVSSDVDHHLIGIMASVRCWRKYVRTLVIFSYLTWELIQVFPSSPCTTLSHSLPCRNGRFVFISCCARLSIHCSLLPRREHILKIYRTAISQMIPSSDWHAQNAPAPLRMVSFNSHVYYNRPFSHSLVSSPTIIFPVRCVTPSEPFHRSVSFTFQPYDDGRKLSNLHVIVCERKLDVRGISFD